MRTTKAPSKRLSPPRLGSKLSRILTVSLFVCAVLGIQLMCQLIGTLDFSRPRFSSYFHHPTVFLMNLLPVVLVMLAAFFVGNRTWIAFLFTSVLMFLLHFINYFKIALRGDPFVADDILIAGEAAGVLGDYTLVFPVWFFVCLAAIAVGTLVLLRFARERISKKRFWLRPVGLALCIAAGAASWCCLYSDASLYETQLNYDFFNGDNEAEYRASHGFLWSFLRSVDEAVVRPPEGYSKQAALAVLNEYEDVPLAQEQKVNVIITMLESYSDLSVFDGIPFTDDAYASLHALQAESFSGTLITDTNGGGTVNAERSVLTGFAYPHSRYRRSTNSYVRWFSEQGYTVEGAHPGFEWFYNRKAVNLLLGFESYRFCENHYDALVTPEHSYAGHADDSLFFSDLRAIYEARDPNTPYFSFNVSYQNHSPYDETALNGAEYIARDGLSDEAYYLVNNYLNGVADTGNRVAAFIDSFRDDTEPVVLVFFGDHKPTLGTSNCYYAELGISVSEREPEGLFNLYSTPYLIWANDAAKERLGKDFSGTGGVISPCFLMTKLFDCCGWSGSQWMQLSRDTRDVLPVLHRDFMYMTDGVLSTTMSSQAQAAYEKYHYADFYMRNTKPN